MRMDALKVEAVFDREKSYRAVDKVKVEYFLRLGPGKGYCNRGSGGQTYQMVACMMSRC